MLKHSINVGDGEKFFYAEEWMTLQEIAAVTCKARSTVMYWIDKGLPATRFDTKLCVRTKDLLEFTGTQFFRKSKGDTNGPKDNGNNDQARNRKPGTRERESRTETGAEPVNGTGSDVVPSFEGCADGERIPLEPAPIRRVRDFGEQAAWFNMGGE